MLCYSSSRNWSEPTHSPSSDPKQGPHSRGPQGKVLGFISGATATNTNVNFTLTLLQESTFTHSTFSTNWYKATRILEDLFSTTRMHHGRWGNLLFNPYLTWYSRSPSNATPFQRLPKFTLQRLRQGSLCLQTAGATGYRHCVRWVQQSKIFFL